MNNIYEMVFSEKDLENSLKRIITLYNYDWNNLVSNMGKSNWSWGRSLYGYKKLKWSVNMHLANERINEICKEYSIGNCGEEEKKIKRGLIEKIKDWFIKRK